MVGVNLDVEFSEEELAEVIEPIVHKPTVYTNITKKPSLGVKLAYLLTIFPMSSADSGSFV